MGPRSVTRGLPPVLSAQRTGAGAPARPDQPAGAQRAFRSPSRAVCSARSGTSSKISMSFSAWACESLILNPRISCSTALARLPGSGSCSGPLPLTGVPRAQRSVVGVPDRRRSDTTAEHLHKGLSIWLVQPGALARCGRRKDGADAEAAGRCPLTTGRKLRKGVSLVPRLECH